MKQELFNIKLDITDYKGVFSELDRYFLSGKPHTVFFVNAHCFNIAQTNHEYRRSINESDLSLNDGIGISIACRVAGLKPRENLNGTDLIPRIIKEAAMKGVGIYLLGGEEGIAENAASKFKDYIPDLKISGTASGYFSERQEQGVIENINNSGAGLLVLGMGVPRQELWATRNKDLLKKVRIIIAGGAILDFTAGKVKRAPLWLRKIRFEWLYRLYLEPKRLWKRYIIGNMKFFYYIFKHKISPVNKQKPVLLLKQ
jgi:N-acetylglucosaminyldiphosphoundecaprenol N-acetyl-beta-D-mannosaminyltransferase